EQTEGHDREFCVEDLESQQHSEFQYKFTLAFSYLSDHMVEHDDELNLTNHVFLQMTIRSFLMMEAVLWLRSAAFQPQSFTDDAVTDGPNFVLVQQNMTDDGGYDRVTQVHSILEKIKIRNTTDTFGKYIPAFIKDIDRHLYINQILSTRIGGDTEEGDPAAILILLHEGVIKYCVTEEKALHEDCKPENLKQLLRCPYERDEL
ncbi:unnamed protein product, partial [Medioppia subpectinata]